MEETGAGVRPGDQHLCSRTFHVKHCESRLRIGPCSGTDAGYGARGQASRTLRTFHVEHGKWRAKALTLG